jgi:hypothetical protein
VSHIAGRASPNPIVADDRARNRLTKFLLRHSMIYRNRTNWTVRHQQWLSGLRFEDRALASTLAHYRSTVALRDTALEAVEADLHHYFSADPFAEAVARLGCYRGLTHMGGLCLGAEVFDWRRLSTARGFMSFTGLTCSENSTGLSERRGSITKAGNSHIRAQLIEPTSAGRHHPSPPRRRHPGHRGPLLDRPEPSLQTLRHFGRPQKRQVRGRGHRSRASRVPLGRDDRHGLKMTQHRGHSQRSAPL